MGTETKVSYDFLKFPHGYVLQETERFNFQKGSKTFGFLEMDKKAL